MIRKLKDRRGQRFGRLTILEVYRVDKKTRAACKCDCGNLHDAAVGNLVSGSVASCGCLQREFLSQRNRKPEGQSTRRSIWNYYRRNARNRGIPWTLSFEEFSALLGGYCYYCGQPPNMLSLTYSRFGDVLHYNGVDRLDNDGGYTTQNAVSCCTYCNLGKHTKTVQQFKAWITNVYKHFVRGELSDDEAEPS